MTKEKLNKIDLINTTAVRWLYWNFNKYNKPIGLKDFSIRNKKHLWLLYMFKNYSIINKYCNYYIKTNIFIYLYLRYIKKFKDLKLYKKYDNIVLINADIFINEIIGTFNEPANLLEEIYDLYYRRK